MRRSRQPATRRAGLVLILLLAGCETVDVDSRAPAGSREARPPAAPTAGAPGSEGSACRSLEPGECRWTPGCATLWGWPPAAYCAAEPEADSRRVVGCHPAKEACPEEETCGGREGGPGLLVFPNRCLPAGWTRRPMSDCCRQSEAPVPGLQPAPPARYERPHRSCQRAVRRGPARRCRRSPTSRPDRRR